MNQYERMVSYIYRYYAGEKGANVGYAKVEKRGNLCRLSAQMRAVPVNHTPQVYLYRQMENGIKTVHVGAMVARGSNLLCKASSDAQKLFQTEETIDDMEGIFIFVEPETYFVTSWKNDNFYLGNWGKESDSEKEEKETSSENNAEKESFSANVSTEHSSEEAVEYADVKAQESAEHADVQMQSICGVCPFKRRTYDYGKKILVSFPSMKPFDKSVAKACVRMELQDIGCLPIASWSLSGNRFLLNGYYSYRHLIFAQMAEGYYVLGVPGIYSEKEKSNALRFGFSEFQSIGEFGQKQGAFGYWMMRLPDGEASDLLR